MALNTSGNNLSMDCTTYREKIDLLLLDALSPAESQALAEHVRACHDCRAEFQAASHLVSGLAALRPAPANQKERAESLAQRLRKELNATGTQAHRWTVTILQAAAAAAVVAIAVRTFYTPLANPTHDPHDPVAWSYGGVSGTKELVDNYPFVTKGGVLALEDEQDGRRVVCVERASGALRWRTPFTVAGALLCADDARAFAFRMSPDGMRELVALNARTGAPLWTAPSPHGTRRTPPSGLMITDDLVVWTEGPTVVAVHAENGTPAWSSSPGKRSPLSAPVLVDRALYVASDEGVFAMDSHDGHPLWQSMSDSRSSVRHLAFPPLVRSDGHRLVVAERRLVGTCAVRSHSLSDGTSHWQRQITAPVHALALDGDVYVRSTDITALTGDTGATSWSAKVGGCGTVAIAHGLLYAVEGRETPLVLALDPRNGKQTWKQRLASSCNGLVIVGDVGYFSSRDGSLYALNVTTEGSG
jgi:outer membrane protein assembly factor BamB